MQVPDVIKIDANVIVTGYSMPRDAAYWINGDAIPLVFEGDDASCMTVEQVCNNARAHAKHGWRFSLSNGQMVVNLREQGTGQPTLIPLESNYPSEQDENG